MEIIEFQQFGWNLVTFGFIGAMCTGLLGFWGIIKQAQAIWGDKSGKSVPVLMHAYGMLFFASGCVYGISIGSLALMIMSIRVLLTIPVLVGLWKYQGFKWWECSISLLFVTAFIALIFLPNKADLYFVIAMGATLSFIPQPLVMLRNRSRGAVSASFLWTIFIGVVFWTAYSFAIGDWVLSTTNPVFLVFVAATLIIWYVMPPAKPKTAGQVADD